MSMTASEARERHLHLIQAKQADQLTLRLAAVNPDGYVQWDELPGWVRPALDTTRRTATTPDAVLPEKAAEPDVVTWMREFVTVSDRRDGWYVLTAFERFPWLSIRPVATDWIGELVRVQGEDLALLSHSRDVLVVFAAEEYEYQAFRRTS